LCVRPGSNWSPGAVRVGAVQEVHGESPRVLSRLRLVETSGLPVVEGVPGVLLDKDLHPSRPPLDCALHLRDVLPRDAGGRDDHGVIIAVWDAAHELPRARPPAELTLEDLDLSEEAFDDNGVGGSTSSRSVRQVRRHLRPRGREVGVVANAPLAPVERPAWCQRGACGGW